MNYINYIRRTFQGAWEIHGDIGTRQYMGYTKKQAIARYADECKQSIFINQPSI